MADEVKTMLDVVKETGGKLAEGLIEMVRPVVPEIRLFPAKTIDGTSYETLVRTNIPTVSFRKANDGVDAGKSAYERKLAQCFILNGMCKCDKAVADAYGSRKSEMFAREIKGTMLGAFTTVSKQVWQGTSADANGFEGLAKLVAGNMHIGQLSANLTANKGTSVYAVNLNEVDGVKFVIGGQGIGLLNPDVEWKEFLGTGANNKSVMQYVVDLTTWIGLSVDDELSVARFDNITNDANKGLTDGMLADLVNLFEEKSGVRPTHLFMTFRSRNQLQKSRSVTLLGNAKVRPDQPTIAPTPTEYEGIPIVCTNGLTNTEAIKSRS